MSEFSLDNALNQCIDQLAAGSSVEDCLRLFPQYADTLRPMLEAGLLTRRAQYNALEVSAAQNRVRSRVVAAMMRQQTSPLRRSNYGGVWRRVAAAFVVILVAVFGTISASSGSIPGDTLYPLKRLTENVQLLFGDGTALREQFASRRINEINTLLAQGREAEVEFEGDVDSINGDLWLIAGLSVRVPAGTADTEAVQSGDRVSVFARTTVAQDLVASAITLLEDRVLPSTPTFTPSLTNTSTSTPTSTSSPSPGLTPSYTATFTPTPTFTATPSPAVLPDNDGDGIPDNADICPTAPGVSNGCPLPTNTPIPNQPPATFAPPPPPTDEHGGDNDNSGPGGGGDDEGSDSGHGAGDDGGGGGDDHGGSGSG